MGGISGRTKPAIVRAASSSTGGTNGLGLRSTSRAGIAGAASSTRAGRFVSSGTAASSAGSGSVVVSGISPVGVSSAGGCPAAARLAASAAAAMGRKSSFTAGISCR
ncbi:hypothetical protein TSOC111612_21180 [Tsukamurella ocularis]